MNELVFIGQDIEINKMIADLEKCLLQDNEQKQFKSKKDFWTLLQKTSKNKSNIGGKRIIKTKFAAVLLK